MRALLRLLGRLLSLVLTVSFGFSSIAKEILVTQVSTMKLLAAVSESAPQYMTHFYAARLAPLFVSRLVRLGLKGVSVDPELLRHAMSGLEWTIAVGA